MEWPEFLEGIASVQDWRKKAFLAVLFLTGCRVSEALALTLRDVFYDHAGKTLYITFHRLKGSKQTDPVEVPFLRILDPLWIADREKLFPWSRVTGWKIVKKAFPSLYPHYFRMNRIMKISLELGDLAVYGAVGITANALDHYRGKVSTKRVGQMLKKEVVNT